MTPDERKRLFRLLTDAIRDGDLNTVQRVFESNPEAMEIESPFGTWLHVAAENGNLEIVTAMLSMGFDVNRKSGL